MKRIGTKQEKATELPKDIATCLTEKESRSLKSVAKQKRIYLITSKLSIEKFDTILLALQKELKSFSTLVAVQPSPEDSGKNRIAFNLIIGIDARRIRKLTALEKSYSLDIIRVSV
jgi:hypothetical protein